MYKMKNIIPIIIMTALLPSLSQAQTKAECTMYYVTAKHGTKNVAVSSDHAITITNTTGAAQTYHITYWNGIMFTAPWYSPIGEKEFDVTVANGETKTLPRERLMKTANFYTKGNYSGQASTLIKLGSKYVTGCENTNNVNIF